MRRHFDANARTRSLAFKCGGKHSQRKEGVMNNAKPPSADARSHSLFFIGRDSRGNWVVQDRDHLRGGLFVDRTQALKFALLENGRSAAGRRHGVRGCSSST
jgi:hypothetical protein